MSENNEPIFSGLTGKDACAASGAGGRGWTNTSGCIWWWDDVTFYSSYEDCVAGEMSFGDTEEDAISRCCDPINSSDPDCGP